MTRIINDHFTRQLTHTHIHTHTHIYTHTTHTRARATSLRPTPALPLLSSPLVSPLPVPVLVQRVNSTSGANPTPPSHTHPQTLTHTHTHSPPTPSLPGSSLSLATIVPPSLPPSLLSPSSLTPTIRRDTTAPTNSKQNATNRAKRRARCRHAPVPLAWSTAHTTPTIAWPCHQRPAAPCRPARRAPPFFQVPYAARQHTNFPTLDFFQRFPPPCPLRYATPPPQF